MDIIKKSPFEIMKDIIENPNIPKSWEFPLFSFQEIEDKFRLYQENKEDKILLFRGHKLSSMKLIPSVYRGFEDVDLVAIEKKKLEEFKNILKEKHPEKHTQFSSDWEFLALAQHYGIKTRLLDWTTDPYVALWFACIGNIQENEENSSSLYVYFADKNDIVNSNITSPFDIPSFKIYEPKVNDLNERLISQNGCFTVHSYNKIESKVIDFPLHKPVNDKIANLIIPNNIRREIIDILFQKGLSHSSIFPDFDGACKEIEYRFKQEKTIKLPDYQIFVEDLKYLIKNSIEILGLMNNYDLGKSVEYSFYFLVHNYTKAETILNIIENEKFKDIPSATILLRSIFEGFINMHKLFLSDFTDKTLEAKILQAKAISSLKTKAFLDHINKDSSEDKEYFINEIEKLKQQIQKNDFFYNLSETEKTSFIEIENLLENQSKQDVINEAIKSGINENNAELIYDYSSNYLNADPYAIDQVEIFAKNGIPNCFITTLLIQTIALLSKTIELFSQFSEQNEITSEKFKKITTLYWDKLSTDLRDQ